MTWLINLALDVWVGSRETTICIKTTLKYIWHETHPWRGKEKLPDSWWVLIADGRRNPQQFGQPVQRGLRQRAPAGVPPVPRAVSVAVSAGLLPHLLRPLLAWPDQRQPTQLPPLRVRDGRTTGQFKTTISVQNYEIKDLFHKLILPLGCWHQSRTQCSISSVHIYSM